MEWEGKGRSQSGVGGEREEPRWNGRVRGGAKVEWEGKGRNQGGVGG